MKIRFLGHASFLLTSDTGVKIITDPYKPGCFDGGIQYEKITEAADIVTISHEHDDHNETDLAGEPSFIRDIESRQIKGIGIKGVDTFHDTDQGSERGSNVIYNMLIDGMNVVHLGDLGHDLSPQEAERIGNADVLFIPVGGYFTIDAKVADNIISLLKPKVVIPMHFKTDKCGFPIASVEDFIKGKDVQRSDSDLELKKDTLPTDTTIYVLNPSK